MSETHVRKNPSEMSTPDPNKVSAFANPNKTSTRKSLSEAHRPRERRARRNNAWSTPDEQLIEAERRTPFQICDVYCAHAEELLAITGQISAALPSRAAYLARTNPRAAAHPDNRSVKAHTQVGNPACAFVWEIRNNKEGALAKSSDAQYAKCP